MRSTVFQRKCLGCNEIFDVTTKNPKQKYCNRKCFLKSHKIFSNCFFCGKKIIKPLCKKSGHNYCSVSCSNKGRAEWGKCFRCGKIILTKAKKFCSKECAGKHRFEKTINDIENGTFHGVMQTLKKYLFLKRGRACEICKLKTWLNNPIPLEVNHKDGNANNNILDNVELICPNCHTFTENYKGKNKGKGRFNRMKRYHAGLSY